MVIIFLILSLCLPIQAFASHNLPDDSVAVERKVNYMALVLDSASSARLKDFALLHMPWEDSKLYCHHMTIAHHTNMTDSITAWVKDHESQTFTIEAVEYGWSEKAFAVKVKGGEVPSVNTLTHVTMATHPSANGQAVDSNYITQWCKLDETITLSGHVEIIWMR